MPESIISKPLAVHGKKQVMLCVAPAGDAAGVTSLSGNLSRAKEEKKSFSTENDHLENIGKMIEAMENTLRSDMDGRF